MAKNREITTIWEGLVLRGIAAILFGFIAVFWPGLTLVTLVYLFSAFILVTGLIGLGMGLVHLFKQDGGSVLNVLLQIVLAVLEIGVGVYLLRHVELSFATFVLLIGLILIVRGVVDFVVSVFSVGITSATYRWVTLLTGMLTILAGVIVLFQPVAGGVTFVWVLGLYALITGPMLLALAYDTKRVADL